MKTLLKPTILLIIIQAFTFTLSGQSLYNSLVDVNGRWALEGDFPKNIFNLSAEEDPIQTHLLLVHQTLAQRSTANLSKAQITNRKLGLQILQEYASQGLFPKNLFFSKRQPVFIDPFDTYCAVGYIISKSGHDPLARKIHEHQNFAYLLEMNVADLNSWVSQSGFSAEELAWIQPGYSPQTLANKMKEGFNGPVKVILPTSFGDIIAGGVFDTAGVGEAKGIAQWISGIAGFDWLGLGTNGLEYEVKDLIEFNGGIVAAGNIYYADTAYIASGVAFWDGSNWTSMGAFYIGALQNVVYDLEVYNGELYAGGMFRSDFLASSFFANIAKWDGSQWQGLPGSPQGVVHALEVHQGELVLAGTFNSIDTLSFNHIASYDGTSFKTLGAGVPAAIYALESTGDTLFAGGQFFSGSQLDTFGFGYFHANQWTRVSNPYLQISSWHTSVETIENTPYGIFVGGNLIYQPVIGVAAKNLLLFTNNDLEPFALLDSTVNCLSYKNGNLYAGGHFTKGSFGFSLQDSLNHIAFFDLTKHFSISETKSQFEVQAFPNPAAQTFEIQFDPFLKVQDMKLTDVKGRNILFQYSEERPGHYTLNVPNAAQGLYLINIITSNGVLEKKIILGQEPASN